MAKRTVNLSIKTMQYSESLEPKGETFVKELKLEDSFEVLTEGTLYTKNGAVYIAYEESEKAGLEDRRTLIKVTDKALTIKRYGDGSDEAMDLNLQEGIKNITEYKMPMGTFDLEVYTNKLMNNLDGDGIGEISADYTIKFDRAFSRRNKLTIGVRPN